MILNNLLHHRQSQSSSVFLTVAYEGLKQIPANGFRDAAAIVDQPNLQSPRNFPQIDVDFSALSRDRLTCVQEQVVQRALELSGIEPACAITFLTNSNPYCVEPRMSTHSLDHAFDRLFYASISPPQGLPSSRERE